MSPSRVGGGGNYMLLAVTVCFCLDFRFYLVKQLCEIWLRKPRKCTEAFKHFLE